MKGKNPEKRDRAIAAALTFVCALGLLLLLFFFGLTPDRVELAVTSTPEIMELEPDFFEPELIQAGDNLDEGPEAAPEEVYEGTASASLNVSSQESPLEVKPADEETELAAQTVMSKFSNGETAGSTPSDKQGAGGNGEGTSGNAKGRTFISCPKPDITLRNKTVVTVNVTINAEGKVTQATATGTADATIRKKCEAAAMQSRWSEKKGASPVAGTITFVITPR